MRDTVGDIGSALQTVTGLPEQSLIMSYVSASNMGNIYDNNAYDGYDAFSKGVTSLTASHLLLE